MKYIKEYVIPEICWASISKGTFTDSKCRHYHAWYNGGGIGIKNKDLFVTEVDMGKFIKGELQAKRDKLLASLSAVTDALKGCDDVKWMKKFETKKKIERYKI